MKTFTLFWLGGKREVLHGETPEQAMNEAGYGQGALRALDFYSHGDNQQYEWKDRTWKIKEHLKMTLGELSQGQCFNLLTDNMIRYVSQKGKAESYCPVINQETIGHEEEDEVYHHSTKVILIPNQTAGIVESSALLNEPENMEVKVKSSDLNS